MQRVFAAAPSSSHFPGREAAGAGRAEATLLIREIREIRGETSALIR
jgi:hypothetical protein